MRRTLRAIVPQYKRLTAQRLRETDELARDFLDAPGHLLILQLLAIKGIAGRVNKTRNDHGAEIEHEAVRESHDR